MIKHISNLLFWNLGCFTLTKIIQIDERIVEWINEWLKVNIIGWINDDNDDDDDIDSELHSIAKIDRMATQMVQPSMGWMNGL